MEQEKGLDLVISEIEIPKISITNKDEIIAMLKNALVNFDRVLTEDTLKEGKEDKAKLNKLNKAIEDKRKEIKKLVMIPYTEIEKDFAEITDLITEASNKLDVQVKAFEEQEKRVKEEQIKKMLELDTTGLMAADSRWLNATYKLKDIKQEILDFVTKYNQDMELLKDEDVTIKDYYNRTLNISATLLEKKRIEDLRKQEEERKQKLEEIKVEAEQEEPVITFETVTEVKNKAILELEITYNQALKLKQFLNENNINYKLKGEIQ